MAIIAFFFFVFFFSKYVNVNEFEIQSTYCNWCFLL